MNIKNNIKYILILLLIFQSNFLFSLQLTNNKAACEVHPIIIQAEQKRVLKLADQFLKEKPVTVTASQCARSAGGKHDYYSA